MMLKKTMGWTVTSVKGKTEGTKLTRMLLIISCLFFVALQTNCTAVHRRKREDPCPKLQVLTAAGCQPCSLCNPDTPNFDPYLIRRSCKKKHLGIINHAGQRPWCDNRNGPFPECPPIPEAVVRSCTQGCKDRGRRFAPGCECQVGCPGQETSSVACTRDLTWTNNGSIPESCSVVTTEKDIEPSITSTTGSSASVKSTDPHPREEAVPWLWVVIGCLLAVLVSVGVGVFFCWWRTRNQFQLSRSSSDSSSSAGPSDKSSKTDDPLLGPEKAEEGLTTEGQGKAGVYSSSQAMSLPSVSHGSAAFVASASEIPGPSAVDTAPEREALLGAGAGDCEQKTASQRALQALTRDYQALQHMTRLFDQENQFDKVTWHTVAKEFLGWDIHQIRSLEYRLRGSYDGSPGDGFFYQVLTSAYQAGKGLLDLLDHLKNRPHYKHPEAERFLWAFWDKWRQENVAGTKPPVEQAPQHVSYPAVTVHLSPADEKVHSLNA